MKLEGIVTEAETRADATFFKLDRLQNRFTFVIKGHRIIDIGQFVEGETCAEGRNPEERSVQYTLVSNLKIYEKQGGRLLHTYKFKGDRINWKFTR